MLHNTLVIGASLNEPHTSDFGWTVSLYVRMYVHTYHICSKYLMHICMARSNSPNNVLVLIKILQKAGFVLDQVQLCRMKLFAATGKGLEVDAVPECSTEWRDACAATLITTVCN